MENNKHRHIKEIAILVLALIIIGLTYLFGLKIVNAPNNSNNITLPSKSNSFNSTI
jgi:hypothetical protein